MPPLSDTGRRAAPRCAALLSCLLATACGPQADEPVDPEPWMAGGWSTVLMTRFNLVETNLTEVSNFSFEQGGEFIGRLDTLSDVDERTWEPVSVDEAFVHPSDADAPDLLGFRLFIEAGTRGCDELKVREVHEDFTINRLTLHRGAVCPVPNGPCPPEADPDDACHNHRLEWCDPPPGCDDEDCFCRL